MRPHKHTQACIICGNNKAFQFPDGLIDAIHESDVVLFAGSGISTEAKGMVYPYTLFEEIAGELNLKTNSFSFPKVMSGYVKRYSRVELVKRIIDRFNYIKSWPNLYGNATAFHREMASIPFFKLIVTTNWDDYFELVSNATPYVYDQDMPFWDQSRRQVLKIHGSINNLGSLVITEEDYKKSALRLKSSLIGSQLKLLLASKTILFIGYSLKDPDFRQIYDFVRNKLQGLHKKAYMVTLDDDPNIVWEKLNIIRISTDGKYFLSQVRKELEKSRCLMPLKQLNFPAAMRMRIREIHFKVAELDIKKYPEVLYCLSYQDGFQDAIDVNLHKVDYGVTLLRSNILSSITYYENDLDQWKRQSRWFDYAYVKGFIKGLYTFLAENKDEKLIMYTECYDIFSDDDLNVSFENFKKLIKSKRRRKKAILAEYKHLAEKHNFSAGMVYQHTPFLL